MIIFNLIEIKLIFYNYIVMNIKYQDNEYYYGFFFIRNSYNFDVFLFFQLKEICFYFQQIHTFFIFLMECEVIFALMKSCN
jgi:hypothetical protein